MPNIIYDSLETYIENIKLVLLFSIPFIIAFAIPLFVPMPTYITIGSIFLRTASIFINMNLFGMAIIVVATFFSLLFLSLAFVAISFIVKTKRTYGKVTKAMIESIEKYTGRVFIIFIAYTAILILVNIASYLTGYAGIITSIIGFILFLFIFYAPSAIVIDNKRIGRAIKDSTKLIFREPQYFLLWLFLAIIILTFFDFLFIALFGTFYSRYAMLIFSSLFILPYFVIFQAEAYMKRFPILKH
ncbi:MAG: hypothetical protein ACP5P2_00155 [Candidatus Micrarchaeia archaeon]|jgi:hypothetical protein